MTCCSSAIQLVTLFCAIYSRQVSQKRLQDFAINRAQLPLNARLELHQTIKLTDVILPGLILETVIFMTLFLLVVPIAIV